MTDLNSLARTLAERIWNEAAIIDGKGCTIFQFEKAEALIREAIEKTLEAASQFVLDYDGTYPQTRPAYRKELANAIRSLKQSNSGMEVKTNVQP
jgi:hypothetical protein